MKRNTLAITAGSAGVITNTATVGANETDLLPTDNTDTVLTTVSTPPPVGDDLTVEVDVAPITCVSTPKGPACSTSGTVELLNNGVAYGMASFTLDMSDATKPPQPGKPLKPKWAFDLQITDLSFDLGANPSAKVNFYLSDDAVFDAGDVPLLKPGKEPTTALLNTLAQVFKTPNLSFKIPKSTSLSGKYVIVVIDFDDQVTKSNDNNNTAAFGPIP